MPIRLDIKRKLTARSDRVKSVDLHPIEPWMLVSLYNGNVHIWNYETQTLAKNFEVCDLPVRAARFVTRKNWVVTGSDDMFVRVFNYNTLERTHFFEAHSDYVRCIAVHPTQSYILTSGDDMLIKLWNWDKNWSCQQVFEGHTHYVMQIVINPKDNNTFASASLDRTLKAIDAWIVSNAFEECKYKASFIRLSHKSSKIQEVWQLGSSTPNFTLEGHEKGVNCVDYYHGGDKPYLISGADDHTVKIWDYQNKNCVQTLDGHVQNVSAVCFHPELPIMLTGSEDGTVRIWHSGTYRLEQSLNYGLERVWTISSLRSSNNVAIGYDEGSIMLKVGREEPAVSMDVNGGKIIWARHSEMQLANLKKVEGGGGTFETAKGDTTAATSSSIGIKDGEILSVEVKDMGSCDIYPQSIAHNSNGRFVVVCGDGEYIIYTAMALRNKAFGPAQEFVWAQDSSEYAIREGSSTVKVFKNFKEKKSFKPDFSADGIFGGWLLGVKSVAGLTFYDWDTLDVIRRIEINPRHVFWSESGELVCLATDDSYFILRYDTDAVANAKGNDELANGDGFDDAFEVLGEVSESVKTGLWVGDCFIYTNSVNRINYYVGGEIVTISHLDRTMYLLGYVAKENRLYLGDKELNIVSYNLQLSVLEYQTAVMRSDFDTADKVLPTVPNHYRTRVAHFLEKQGFRSQALAVSTDIEHKFDLAVQLGNLETAHSLAVEACSIQKWRQLGELATAKGDLALAEKCLCEAQDFGGLLLLASSSGNAEMVSKLAVAARTNGKNNISFVCYMLLGKLEKCLELLIETDRIPEAAFFARTYLPSQISRVVKLWRESLLKVSEKRSQSLADPKDYANLFPGLEDALKTEKYLKAERSRLLPASAYPSLKSLAERDPINEMKQAEEAGKFKYDFPGVPAFYEQLETNGLDEESEVIVETLPTIIVDLPSEVLKSEPVAVATPPVVSQPPPEISLVEDSLVEQEILEELDNMDLDGIDVSDVNIDDDEDFL